MDKTDVITAAINYKNDLMSLQEFKTIVEQAFSSQHSNNVVLPAVVGSVEFCSADQIEGGTIRIQLKINGILFKRLWHKSGLYPAIWDDVSGHFGQVDISSERSGELEAIFKAWCIQESTSEIKLLSANNIS